ncbi:MAG: Mth938-like domain-containing protein [Gammaproteobacteria bacterium]|nr:Mth938-like domain-containing protein [Gammaproteobacteria bacterium]
MKISLDNGTADYRITAYEPGSITINEEIIETAVIVHAGGFRLWQAESIESLTEALILTALEDKPDILLLGTGIRQQFPAPALMKPVAESGTGLEVMDTAAACRTYNILISEDRHVVAALLPG